MLSGTGKVFLMMVLLFMTTVSVLGFSLDNCVETGKRRTFDIRYIEHYSSIK